MAEQIIDIADEIRSKVTLLVDARNLLKSKGNLKSRLIAEYEKTLAIIMIRLKNGCEYELEGNKVKDVSTTTLEKIARGLAWKEKMELETAETDYKSLITFIQTIEAEVNALQSINKYLANG
jgi:hypothetical protein